MQSASGPSTTFSHPLLHATPPPPAPSLTPERIDLTGDDDSSHPPPSPDRERQVKRQRTEPPQSSSQSSSLPWARPVQPYLAAHIVPQTQQSLPANPTSSNLWISQPVPQAFSSRTSHPFPPFPANTTGIPRTFSAPSADTTTSQLSNGRVGLTPDVNKISFANSPNLPIQRSQSLTPASRSSSSHQVIDLTRSPSPQSNNATPLPDSIHPKTPICIGLLTVTALVLYPIPYLSYDPTKPKEEWAPVRLRHDAAARKVGPGGIQETIHIITPHITRPTGEVTGGENFGVVEAKAANGLGEMLQRGVIRFDARVRRGISNMPIIPLQLLVFTPKGNIPVVSSRLQACGLLLEHPDTPPDLSRHPGAMYHNPHNPPPGGFRKAMFGRPSAAEARWSQPAVAGRTVEVQRSHVDEVFKSLRSGDDLEETDPGPNVATPLYPHQKKAISFLLEREGEIAGPGGKSSSLWVVKKNAHGQATAWFNSVTQREVAEEPRPCKGALLADDMGLGKSISVIALIAATFDSSRNFITVPLPPLPPPPRPVQSEAPLTAAHFAGAVWGMPDVSSSTPEASALSAKAKAKAKAQEQRAQEEYTRAARIKVKSRATLIVCPLSTIVNWEDQFREHWAGEVTVVGGASSNVTAPVKAETTEANGSPASGSEPTTWKRPRNGTPISVYIYHGTARKPDPNYLADFDAVLTTFSTLASEYSRQTKSTGPAEDDEEDSDGGAMQLDSFGAPVVKKKKQKRKAPGPVVEVTSPLQSVHWFRVVLDEAHSIKETSTVASRASCDLVADRRLCLTGTPVQNKLDDIYALIKFLRVEPFDDKVVWTEFIGGPVKFGQALGVARLQTIMKAITLRRTKETKGHDGRSILSLPPRRDELRMLQFEKHEQEIYESFFDESKAEFNQLSETNQVMKNYVGILQKILRLRQICDHYELVKNVGADAASQQDLAVNYDEIIAAIAKEGINVTRATAVFALLRESGTAQCVECGVELATPVDCADGLDTADGVDAAGGKRGRKPKGSASNSRGPTRAGSPCGPQPVMTRCQHLFCIACFRTSVCPNWPKVELDVQRQCSACQCGLRPAVEAVEVRPDACVPPECAPKAKPTKREKRQRGLPLTAFNPSTKVKALLGDLIPFSRANPHSANYNPSSIEVQMVDNQGNNLDDGIVKTVVFSQWTSMLDKIEDALEVAGIHYERLDGTMKREERNRAMDALKYDPRCEVLLVSLRAGGVGLNLTTAQRVYLMDPYWNPAVENQAVDRIHRLGQTKPVTAIKFIIENTIEAKLLEVQKRKKELAKMTLGQTLSKAQMHQRRMEELNQLFAP